MWLTNFEKTSCLKAERSKIEGAVDRIEDFVYWECFIVGKDDLGDDIFLLIWEFHFAFNIYLGNRYKAC